MRGVPSGHGYYANGDGELHYTYCASLRLSHPSTDPSSWTDSLGLQPDLIEMVGEPRFRGKHRKQYGIAKCSFFVHELQTPAESCEFEKFLAIVADGLADKADFINSLVAEGGDAELFIGYFLERTGTGFFLSSELQQRICALQLALNLHIYNYDPTGESTSVPIKPNS
ncbi:MAG: hypothetical protein U1F20_02370 [Lysobacterales bacterium]